MGILGLLKRLIPFLLTLVVGLLVASIFIPIKAPGFGEGWRRHQECDRQMKAENDRMRDRLAAQDEEIRELRQKWSDSWHGVPDTAPMADDLRLEVPAVPDPPRPPAAPKRAR